MRITLGHLQWESPNYHPLYPIQPLPEFGGEATPPLPEAAHSTAATPALLVAVFVSDND